MEKFERFLEKYSWLLVLGIWLLLIFWAAQGHFVVEKAWELKKEESSRHRNEDTHLMREAGRKLIIFGNELEKKARFDREYGPRKYYEDMKKLKIRNRELYHRELPVMTRILLGLQAYSMPRGAFRADRASIAELVKSRESYRQWLKTADINKNDIDMIFINEDYGEKLEWKEIAPGIWEAVLWLVNWFAILYKRSFFFVLILYLVRMSKQRWVNRGILATILADKRKFLLAVFAWPVFITKYPSNMIREIRVEAELRRIKNSFRQFSLKDKLRIKEIANSVDYKSWLANFRSENEFRFQKSFLFALVVTISIHAFSPIISFAEASCTRDDLVIEVSCEAEGLSFRDSENSSLCHDESPVNQCLTGTCPDFPKLLVVRTEITREKFKKRRVARKIDHIPLSRVFSLMILIPN